jgi:CubicO group peptidase (beta-lactamase class C family)
MKERFFKHFLSLLIVSAFILSGAAPAALAQAASQSAVVTDISDALATIEQKVEARRKELGIPGMSLAIVKDGKIIYAKGLGYKDFEKQVPATADTQFAIGSSTKAFTGLSVLMTQDEGKLSLDASPRTVLPYFKMADPETDKNMTIRDLLTHSSGLNRTDIAMITGKLTRAELIRVAGEAKPIGKLREKFGYQNLMFATAGEVVAVAQKTPWEKFVPERIFSPLGMTNSNMSISDLEKAKDKSFGYAYNFDTKETKKLPYRPIDEVAPAGSINSSANDMAKWLQFIQAGGAAPDGKRLVSETGFAEWMTPRQKVNPAGTVNYALGWFVQKWNDLTVVQHGGNIDGFNALVAMIPEKKLGFVMLTNVSGSPLGGELMPLVWENILGKPAAKETVAAVLPVEKEVGKYNFAAAGFDMDVQLKDGKLQALVPGQPTYSLEHVSGRKYKLAGAPDGFFVTFKDTELFLEQPQGNYTLPRRAADAGIGTAVTEKKEEAPKIDLTVDELMSKAIEASGGEANWKKLTSRITVADVDMEQQGVKATATSYAKAPNLSATETVMTALGKKIALGWEYFDGTNAEEAYTFAPAEKLSGKRLEDTRLGSDFHSILGWKLKYKTIKIDRMVDCGEAEKCYAVVFEPEKGTKFTEFYSANTFLMKRRTGIVTSSTSSVEIPYSIKFEDYREVDGVKLPFKMTNSNPGSGDTVTVVKSIKHNVPVEDTIFKAKKLEL